MCRNISYLLLAIFILFCGCASKMNVLNENNIKVPEHVYTSSHIPTGMSVQVFIAAMSKCLDDYHICPKEYLDVGNSSKINKLSNNNIVLIMGKIKIANPKQQSYTIKTVSKKKYEKIKYPLTCTHVIYKGDAEQKVFTFDKEIERRNSPLVDYNIIIRSGDAEVFNIQTKYKIE